MTATNLSGAQPPVRMKLSDSRPDLDAVLQPHIINARSALMNALSVAREELGLESGQKVVGDALASMTQEIAILSGRLREIVASGNPNTP